MLRAGGSGQERSLPLPLRASAPRPQPCRQCGAPERHGPAGRWVGRGSLSAPGRSRLAGRAWCAAPTANNRGLRGHPPQPRPRPAARARRAWCAACPICRTHPPSHPPTRTGFTPPESNSSALQCGAGLVCGLSNVPHVEINNGLIGGEPPPLPHNLSTIPCLNGGLHCPPTPCRIGPPTPGPPCPPSPCLPSRPPYLPPHALRARLEGLLPARSQRESESESESGSESESESEAVSQ